VVRWISSSIDGASDGRASFKAARLLCRLGHGPTKTPALITAQLKRLDGPLTVLGSAWATAPGGSSKLGTMGMRCLEALFEEKNPIFSSVSQLGFAGGMW